ncbi:alpha/beta hydrolase [Alistipes sp. OttesenSCG-928-L06]|nr:alpha/beta hydrolase [Alistipes sp. OttesenSCG-928-L06]
MEKFTSLDDTAVHYMDIERGDRVLVLLHGYLESLEVWDELAGQLGKVGYRVISLDLPGHGISEVIGETHSMEFLAGIVAQLLDKLNVPKVTVIGHSMGGYVALAFAELYPDKLDGIVLFHATPDADSDEKKADRRREIEIVRAGRKEMLSRTLPGKRYAAENRKRMTEEIDAGALQVMLTEDEGIVALLNGMAERKDRNEVLQKLNVPELFIFGRHDELISPEKAEAVIAKNPQAKVAWLERSGHMGFLEEPAATLQMIEEFVPLARPESC